MTTQSTELHIGTSKHHNRSYDTAIQWLHSIHSIQFYLHTNELVYGSDLKRIIFTLLYIIKGFALTWVSTFRQCIITDIVINFETWANFCTVFKTSFEHHDQKNNTIAWLSTKRMISLKKNRQVVYSSSLTEFNLNFQNNITLSGMTDHIILISYYSVAILPPLMEWIYQMETPPDIINNWYKKAAHFQTKWECAEEITHQHSKSSSHIQPHSTPSRNTHDLNAMDVDSIKVLEITPWGTPPLLGERSLLLLSQSKLS